MAAKLLTLGYRCKHHGSRCSKSYLRCYTFHAAKIQKNIQIVGVFQNKVVFLPKNLRI